MERKKKKEDVGWCDGDSRCIYFCRHGKFFENLFFAYRGETYQMAFTETHLDLWVYRYILNRWSRIVFDLFLHQTHLLHVSTRIWISAYMGYTCDMRTPYRRPTTYIIYYYHRIRYFILYYYSPHRYR